MTFSNDQADLDFILADSDGSLIHHANSNTDNESSWNELTAGTYQLVTYTRGSEQADYDLTIDAQAPGIEQPDRPSGDTADERGNARDVGALEASDTYTHTETLGEGIDMADWYRFEVSEATPFSAELEAGSATSDVDLTLEYENGRYISSTTGSGDDKSLEGELPAGTYYLKTTIDSGSEAATYNLRLKTEGDNEEPQGDTPDQRADAKYPGSLKPGSRFEHTEEVGGDDNADWYQFYLPEKSTISASALFDHDAGNLDLTLTDANGNIFYHSDSASDNETIQGEALQAGTYYLGVNARSGAAEYDLDVQSISGAVDGAYLLGPKNPTFNLGQQVSMNDLIRTSAPGGENFDYIVVLDPAGTEAGKLKANDSDRVAEGVWNLTYKNNPVAIEYAITTPEDLDKLTFDIQAAGENKLGIIGMTEDSGSFSVADAMVTSVNGENADTYAMQPARYLADDVLTTTETTNAMQSDQYLAFSSNDALFGQGYNHTEVLESIKGIFLFDILVFQEVENQYEVTPLIHNLGTGTTENGEKIIISSKMTDVPSEFDYLSWEQAVNYINDNQSWLYDSYIYNDLQTVDVLSGVVSGIAGLFAGALTGGAGSFHASVLASSVVSSALSSSVDNTELGGESEGFITSITPYDYSQNDAQYYWRKSGGGTEIEITDWLRSPENVIDYGVVLNQHLNARANPDIILLEDDPFSLLAGYIPGADADAANKAITHLQVNPLGEFEQVATETGVFSKSIEVDMRFNPYYGWYNKDKSNYVELTGENSSHLKELDPNVPLFTSSGEDMYTFTEPGVYELDGGYFNNNNEFVELTGESHHVFVFPEYSISRELKEIDEGIANSLDSDNNEKDPVQLAPTEDQTELKTKILPMTWLEAIQRTEGLDNEINDFSDLSGAAGLTGSFLQGYAGGYVGDAITTAGDEALMGSFGKSIVGFTAGLGMKALSDSAKLGHDTEAAINFNPLYEPYDPESNYEDLELELGQPVSLFGHIIKGQNMSDIYSVTIEQKQGLVWGGISGPSERADFFLDQTKVSDDEIIEKYSSVVSDSAINDFIDYNEEFLPNTISYTPYSFSTEPFRFMDEGIYRAALNTKDFNQDTGEVVATDTFYSNEIEVLGRPWTYIGPANDNFDINGVHTIDA
jgi:hypothetical protein